MQVSEAVIHLLHGLHNSLHHTLPHSIILNCIPLPHYNNEDKMQKRIPYSSTDFVVISY